MPRKSSRRRRLCRKCTKSIFGKGWNGDTTNENVVSKLRRLSLQNSLKNYLKGKGVGISRIDKKNGK